MIHKARGMTNQPAFQIQALSVPPGNPIHNMSIRILISLSIGAVAIPAAAQQYVEWFSPADEVTCDSIAVSTEFDERLRWHEETP